MRKYVFYIVFFSLVSFSCSDKKKNKESDIMLPEPQVSDPLAEGEKLIGSSDCRSCHHNTNRLVGPSYREIAEKYNGNEEDIDFLIKKIINGGSGVWGVVPMPPHDNLSKEDAEKMVKFVLSQKK